MANEVSDHAHEDVVMRNLLKVPNQKLYGYMPAVIVKKPVSNKEIE